MADLSTLKIVVDTTDLTKATVALKNFTAAAATAAKPPRQTGVDAYRKAQEDLGRQIIAITNNTNRHAAAMARMEREALRAAQSTDILSKYTHQFKRTLMDLTPIISGLGLLTLAHGAIQATDHYTKLTSQLKIATNTTTEYAFALSEVKRISSAAQVDINAIGSLYQRLSLALQASGRSQKDVALITETVSLGLKANGASARESASAMLQLSQSFGSGRMAGEEFNSMAEAAPNILRALATSMGVPYGALKGLAAEGKITTEVMARAFTDPALLASFQAQAASMRTITGSWVELTNALVLYVGQTSKASGGVGLISGALSLLANNLNFVANSLFALAAFMATKFIASIVLAEGAILGFALSIRAAIMTINPIVGLISLAVGGGIAIWSAWGDEAEKAGNKADEAARKTLVNLTAWDKLRAEYKTDAYLIEEKETKKQSIIEESYKKQAEMGMIYQESGLKILAINLNRRNNILSNADASVKKTLEGVYKSQLDAEMAHQERMINGIKKMQTETAEMLAKIDEKKKTGGRGSSGTTKEHESRMLIIAAELQASINADGEKLSHSEKVSIAWMKLKDEEKTKQEALNYVIAQQNALTLDSIETEKSRLKTSEAYDKSRSASEEKRQKSIQDSISSHQKMIDKIAADEEANTKKIANSITDGMVQGFLSGKSAWMLVRDAVRQDIIDTAIKPQLNLVVTAGVDWTKALIANTLATDKNTSASGAGGAGGSMGSVGTGVMYAVAAYTIYKAADMLFGIGQSKHALGSPTYEGTLSRTGFSGGMRQGYEEDMGAFSGGTQYSSTMSALSSEQTKKIAGEVKDLQKTFDALGFEIGDMTIGTREWSAQISGVTDLSVVLADTMGNMLLPALERFRIEGENLSQTAQRLTDVFKATSQFISGLGVNEEEAFGQIGIASGDARIALLDAAGGLQNFTTLAQQFSSSILTPAEQLNVSLDAVGKTFASLGIESVYTKDAFQKLIQDNIGNPATVIKLLSVSDAFARVVDSAEQAAQASESLAKEQFKTALTAVDALRAFGISVRELQRSLWAGSQTPLSSTYSVTRSQFAATNELAASGDINAQGNLSGAATAFLDASKKQAMSAIEYARDFAFVQNSLDTTATATEDVVSAADMTLQAAVDANEFLKSIETNTGATKNNITALAIALDALPAAITGANGTVSDAMVSAMGEFNIAVTNSYSQLVNAIIGGYGNIANAIANSGTAGSVSGGIPPTTIPSVPITQIPSVTAASTSVVSASVSQPSTAISEAYTQAQAEIAAQTLANASEARKALKEKVAGLIERATIGGLSTGVSMWQGVPEAGIQGFNRNTMNFSTWLAEAQNIYNAMPSFALGGQHEGGLRLVGENGPELEFTGPSTIMSNSNTRSLLNNDDVVAELRALREEVQYLRAENKAGDIAIERNTNKTMKILDKFDGQGMPEVREAA